VAKLSPEIEKALNKQINQEMAAAYNYMAMAAFFDRSNLAGFASWMIQQRAEELTHAMKIYKYILDRGGRIVLESVPKPAAEYDTVEKAFETAVKQEETNTAIINEVYSLAVEQKDYATQSQMQWFVDEQVEEEHSVNEALSLVRLAGENRSAMLVLNNQFAGRGGQHAVVPEGDA